MTDVRFILRTGKECVNIIVGCLTFFGELKEIAFKID